MSYSESTTIGEIMAISSEVLSKYDIVKIGKREAAKVFLQKLLDLDEKTTYEETELAYRKCSPKENIPNAVEEFWEFIEIEYLHLKFEPRQKYIELAMEVTQDLGAIASNLNHIKNELSSLEKKKHINGRISAEDRYYRNQLQYYEQKNLKAKNEIVDFLTFRIKDYAVNAASIPSSAFYSVVKDIVQNFLGTIKPYSFGRRISNVLPDPYDVHGLDKYTNKFIDLPLPYYQIVVKELQKKPSKFKEFALSYINGKKNSPSARDKLVKLVERSHILAGRKSVIEAMLNHFHKKDYISFVSMAPLQIEGIFSDICREIGISENQLDFASLNNKLEHIDQKMSSFYFFEYYSFKFPVLRNLVAHGGLVNGDLEEIAINLLLDLIPVCQLTTADELPINHALNVLEEAAAGKTKSLIEWLYLSEKVIIPDFYDVSTNINSVNVHYSSLKFWTDLKSELKKISDIKEAERSPQVKAAGILKSRKIALAQAEEFLISYRHIVQASIDERNAILVKSKSKVN